MNTLPEAQDFTDVALTQVQTKKVAVKGAMEHHVSLARARLIEQALLLKKQLEELQDREELAKFIYSAHYYFEPVMMKTYTLYKSEEAVTLSLIHPDEWDTDPSPLGEFIYNVRQLGDSTWEIVYPDEV